MFIVSYVVVTVKARLIDFDRHLEEAAMDLGADEWTTFRKITLPLLAPQSSARPSSASRSRSTIRDHVLRRRLHDDVPAVRLGSSACLRAAAGQRRRERDLPRRGRGHDRQRPLGAPHRRRVDEGLPGPFRVPEPIRSIELHDGEPPTSSSSRRTTSGCTSRGWAATRPQDVPIIVRGDGCYLEDANGKRYLDALAGLFSVNIGYAYGEEIGQAALEQMRELPFYTNWSYAHPRAIELAAEVASLAPGDLNRVFFVSGGSEAVESAWKLARQYYAARGEKASAALRSRDPARRDRRCRRGRALQGDRAPHRLPRHDVRCALAQRHPGAARAVRAARARGPARPQHEPVPPPAGGDGGGVHRVPARRPRAGDPRDGPETVCLVHMEPVQNAGGCFTPPAGYWQGVRAICDEYDILLSADEVITAFGRVGHWFGSERYDIRRTSSRAQRVSPPRTRRSEP